MYNSGKKDLVLFVGTCLFLTKIVKISSLEFPFIPSQVTLEDTFTPW